MENWLEVRHRTFQDRSVSVAGMMGVTFVGVALLSISVCVWSYCLLHRLGAARPVTRCWSGADSALSFSGDGDDEVNNDKASSFDMDFAEAMSKPLPEWFLEEKQKKEELMKEVMKNRERIMDEFRAKYEISAEEKERDRKEKEAQLNARRKAIAANKNKSGFLAKALGISTKADELVEEEETTRDKWEKFWVEEEETTGFSLPGFFEVFPELKLMWPTWAKKRDGSAIECEVDSDCQFPQACCPHPIIPGDKFCCTGWTQRIMVPAYARQMIQSDAWSRGDGDDNAPETGGYGLPEN